MNEFNFSKLKKNSNNTCKMEWSTGNVVRHMPKPLVSIYLGVDDIASFLSYVFSIHLMNSYVCQCKLPFFVSARAIFTLR